MTHRIKLIKVYTEKSYDSYEDSYYDADFSAIATELSNWAEVTSEELELLRSYQFKDFMKKKGFDYVIIEEKTTEVPTFIKDLKEFIADEKKKIDIENKKREIKAAEAKAKREKTKIERAKKQLEKTKKLLKEAGELDE